MGEFHECFYSDVKLQEISGLFQNLFRFTEQTAPSKITLFKAIRIMIIIPVDK